MKKIIVISSVVIFLGIIFYLSFTVYQMMPPNRAYCEIGSRWASSDPDIVYWVNPDGSMKGEMKYNGKTIKLRVGSMENFVSFTADNGTNVSYESDLSIHTGIRKSSDTKIVLYIIGTNIPGYKYKQITFIRSQ